MARYSYKAMDATGEIQTGEMEGQDRDNILDQLTRQGLIPVDVFSTQSGLMATLNKPLFQSGSLSAKQLLNVTREMATLIGAGLSLERSLQVLSSMASDKKITAILKTLLTEVREGESLANAMGSAQDAFPKFYISMIGAGEASGTLDIVLERLAGYLKRAVDIQEKIRSALLYPALLMVMVVLTMVLIITVILPQFEPIFDQVGDRLPWATELVMSFGRFVNNNGALCLVVILAMIAGITTLFKNQKSRIYVDQVALKVPVLGSLIMKNEISRFHRMMATLLQNGIPLTSAFTISRDGISNRLIYSEMGTILTRLKEGRDLSAEYLKVSFIPTLAKELTRVGEDTGQLDVMLIRTADILDEDVKNLVDRLMALMVPLLTIGMGLLIAGMIASILLGIMSINEIAY